MPRRAMEPQYAVPLLGLFFFVVALLMGLFGEPIRGFIDRYFNLLCLAFFGLLVLGFVVIKVLA